MIDSEKTASRYSHFSIHAADMLLNKLTMPEASKEIFALLARIACLGEASFTRELRYEPRYHHLNVMLLLWQALPGPHSEEDLALLLLSLVHSLDFEEQFSLYLQDIEVFAWDDYRAYREILTICERGGKSFLGVFSFSGTIFALADIFVHRMEKLMRMGLSWGVAKKVLVEEFVVICRSPSMGKKSGRERFLQVICGEKLWDPGDPEEVFSQFQLQQKNPGRYQTAFGGREIENVLIRTLENLDGELRHHSLSVAGIGKKMALGVGNMSGNRLFLAGLLHDFGKIRIPKEILHKKTPLTKAEWEVIQKHPLFLKEFLIDGKPGEFSQALEIASHHHSYLDGSGYPWDEGGEISGEARVLQVADIFSALTEDRPYRPAYHSEEALDIVREDGKRGKIDLEAFEILREVSEAQRKMAHG